MVRINIINPRYLTDQHLIAEYLEILMLFGYVKRYPMVKKQDIPKYYGFGKGHIKFFKNKLKYLKKRHELIKKEMKKRGFATNKNIELNYFKKELINDWNPYKKDFDIIKKRLLEKIEKKPDYYRYYKEKKDIVFLKKLIKNA